MKKKALKSALQDAPGHASVPGNDIVKLTFNIPKSTRQKWKAAALDRQMTVTDLIVEAMQRHLS